MNEWVNVSSWRNERRVEFMVTAMALLQEADLLPEWVLRQLDEGGDPERVVRHLIEVGVSRGLLPSGCQPLAFGHDWTLHAFYLVLTHEAFDRVPVMERAPRVDLLSGWPNRDGLHQHPPVTWNARPSRDAPSRRRVEQATDMETLLGGER